MRKFIFIVIVLAMSSCGKSTEEKQALTPEQQTQLVDSVAQHLNEQKDQLQQKTDSVTNHVDSLLKDI